MKIWNHRGLTLLALQLVASLTEPGPDAPAYEANPENFAAVIRYALSPGSTGVLLGPSEVEDDQMVRGPVTSATSGWCA